MEDIIFWVWLSFFELNPAEKILLVKNFELKRLYTLDKDMLRKILLNKLKLNFDRINLIVEEITNEEYKIGLKEKIRKIREENIEIITIKDTRYPKHLKEIYDPPSVLYAKGNIKLLNNQMISVTGTRNSSSYGNKVSLNFAKDISKENITVVSGLSHGIDKYAHIGALDSIGKTIAVLPGGINNIYPKENSDLALRIINERGLILSEYYIDVIPKKEYFIERNRIIFGISRKVAIVELESRSGLLCAINNALDYGREIYAVPGNIDSALSCGTNELIRDGAMVLVNIKDII